MRISLFVLLLLTPALEGCTGMSGEGDIRSSSYSTFQEASQNGAVTSGWLPEALPRSATNIVEVHNVDSNELWAKFRYSENDIEGLIKECALDQKARLPSAKRTKRSAGWWPIELTDDSDAKSREPWVIYSCPRMRHARSDFSTSIAFDRASKTALYWLVR